MLIASSWNRILKMFQKCPGFLMIYFLFALLFIFPHYTFGQDILSEWLPSPSTKTLNSAGELKQNRIPNSNKIGTKKSKSTFKIVFVNKIIELTNTIDNYFFPKKQKHSGANC